MVLSIHFAYILTEIMRNNFSKHIDNGIQRMVYCLLMNGVQLRILCLQELGWTLAAIADELDVTPNAIEKWKAGDRHPRLEKPVIDALDQLTKRKRIPKKRRYAKGSRAQKSVE
jgi:hypothetical protein